MDEILTRYADENVLMADSERKLQNLLDRVGEENLGRSNHQLQVDRKYMISKEKRKLLVRIGDISMKKVYNFQYLGFVLTEDRKHDTQNRVGIGLSEKAFQKINKVQRNRER